MNELRKLYSQIMLANILVVDDSRVNQHMLKLLLKRNNFDVTIASDGQKGLAALEENDIDLVISDIQMPRMNGLAMVQAIREHDVFSDLPVLMLTATGDDKNVEDAQALGVDGFIVQPFDSHELVATVRSLLI